MSDLKTELLERHAIKAVPRDSGCIEWTGAKTATGYGRAHAGGKHWLAHRLFYTVYRGEIPKGMYVCHSCDVPSCVNPEHLFLGTQADNLRDMDAKGRRNSNPANGIKAAALMRKSKTHCKHGHEYVSSNVYIAPDNSRACLQCKAEAKQRCYDKQSITRAVTKLIPFLVAA